ncbi:MAG: uroporphyrinogen decarboxylase family protein [Rectinemataceae bacterium]
MTSYERVKAALDHREPDRLPFDLGGSVLTGINVHAYVKLRRYLGLPEREIQLVDVMQQLARVDDDLLARLEVDVACVDPDPPDGPTLATSPVREGEYWRMADEWGISWKMPVEGGHYFDMTDRPLKNAETPADLDGFPWPDPKNRARFATIKSRADRAAFGEKKAYILGRQYAGIWETALWMCGFEKFFADMLVNEEFAHALMRKITELKMAYWETALETVGSNVLVVSEADDLATQSSLLCSPELYERMVHPYHKELFTFIRKKAAAPVHIFYHTCGSVKPLVHYLIEEGVDVLNPVQVNAAGMDTRELKREFGKDITFWGGGVDTQHVLPFGTPTEVRDEVKRRIDDLAPGGGFVFATVHNVQSDVSPENFMAMWEAMREYGAYR